MFSTQSVALVPLDSGSCESELISVPSSVVTGVLRCWLVVVVTFCELRGAEHAPWGSRYAHGGAAGGRVQLLSVLPLPQGQRRLLIGFRGDERVHAADGGRILQQTHGRIKTNGPMGTDEQSPTPSLPLPPRTDERHSRPPSPGLARSAIYLWGR